MMHIDAYYTHDTSIQARSSAHVPSYLASVLDLQLCLYDLASRDSL